jgi:hypothetical protein
MDSTPKMVIMWPHYTAYIEVAEEYDEDWVTERRLRVLS